MEANLYLKSSTADAMVAQRLTRELDQASARCNKQLPRRTLERTATIQVVGRRVIGVSIAAGLGAPAEMCLSDAWKHVTLNAPAQGVFDYKVRIEPALR